MLRFASKFALENDQNYEAVRCLHAAVSCGSTTATRHVCARWGFALILTPLRVYVPPRRRRAKSLVPRTSYLVSRTLSSRDDAPAPNRNLDAQDESCVDSHVARVPRLHQELGGEEPSRQGRQDDFVEEGADEKSLTSTKMCYIGND